MGVTMCQPQVPPSTPFQQQSLSCLGSPGVKVLGLLLPQLNSGQGRNCEKIKQHKNTKNDATGTLKATPHLGRVKSVTWTFHEGQNG